MKDIKILITAAGSPTWPQMADDLKNNGERNITIIGTDLNVDPTMLQYIDRVFPAPVITDPQYVDVLLNICEKEKVDVLVPGISQELEAIQSRLDEFKALDVKVAICEGEGLSIANDKIKLYRFLESNGFNIPNYRVASDIDSIVNACYEIGYPEKSVCIKISNGAGSRGVRIIDANSSRFEVFINEKPSSAKTTLEDFISILRDATEIPELMIMEYLPGNEYCLDLLADNGDVKYIVGQEIIRQSASTPIVAVIKQEDFVYEQAKKIVALLKLDGNIGFDYKYDASGKLWITEICLSGFFQPVDVFDTIIRILLIMNVIKLVPVFLVLHHV